MNLDPEKRQRLLLILALAAIGVWASDRLLLTPLTRAWKSRTEAIASLRKDVAKGRQLLERERTLRDRWAEMQEHTLPGAVSTAEGTVLRSFDRWSLDSRVSITSIKPQWRQPEDDYRTLECRVDAFGSLSTLTRFLFELERDPLALKVDSVEFTARDAEGSQVNLGLQVSGLYLSPVQP